MIAAGLRQHQHLQQDSFEDYRWLHRATVCFRLAYLRKVWGIHLSEGVGIPPIARLDYTNLRRLYICDHTINTPGVQIFIHDCAHARHVGTRIGKNRFIGAGAIVHTGATVGINFIVGAGSVFTKGVPPHSMVAGNPAKVVRTDLQTGQCGRIYK